MFEIQMKNFKSLNSHQAGIKIKNIILQQLKSSEDIVVLDFSDIDVSTDSFMQQLTTILSDEIGFDKFRQKIKFKNLNDFLKELVKSKIYAASKKVA